MHLDMHGREMHLDMHQQAHDAPAPVSAEAMTWAAEGRQRSSPEISIMASSHLSSRLRKSPFFERTMKAGAAEFTVYNRMLMPLRFNEGPEAEYKALTRDVAIWDVGAERQVSLKGPDAGRLAQLLTCRDVSGLSFGKCVYAIMCGHDGVVINDPVLLRLAEDEFWFSIATRMSFC